MIVYDKNMNPLGDFDGEYVYSLKDGSMFNYRIEDEVIYAADSRNSGLYIGTFEDGVATLTNGDILFQCD